MLRCAKLSDTAISGEVILADGFVSPRLCELLLKAALAAPEGLDFRHLELETLNSGTFLADAEALVEKLRGLSGFHANLLLRRAFLIRYRAGEGHAEHTDPTSFTINVGLTPPEDYTGGDILFRGDGDQYLRLGHKLGRALLHSGSLLHSAEPLSDCIHSAEPHCIRCNLIVWCCRVAGTPHLWSGLPQIAQAHVVDQLHPCELCSLAAVSRQCKQLVASAPMWVKVQATPVEGLAAAFGCHCDKAVLQSLLAVSDVVDGRSSFLRKLWCSAAAADWARQLSSPVKSRVLPFTLDWGVQLPCGASIESAANSLMAQVASIKHEQSSDREFDYDAEQRLQGAACEAKLTQLLLDTGLVLGGDRSGAGLAELGLFASEQLRRDALLQIPPDQATCLVAAAVYALKLREVELAASGVNGSLHELLSMMGGALVANGGPSASCLCRLLRKHWPAKVDPGIQEARLQAARSRIAGMVQVAICWACEYEHKESAELAESSGTPLLPAPAEDSGSKDSGSDSTPKEVFHYHQMPEHYFEPWRL